MEFARHADVLYLDAQYLKAEYDGEVGINDEPPQSRHGWGHCTIEAAVETGLAAEVGYLHLGHHDPKRTDKQLTDIQNYAQHLADQYLADQYGNPSSHCEVLLAREEMVVRI